jgi:prepilin-type N-terminal cleavage/methylation domain-containing protein
MNNTSQSKRKNSAGFSLVELMIAVFILSIAVMGGMAMIVIGIARNGGNRMDTAATNVAQTILEDIASASPNSNAALTIKDCAGNSVQITTAAGGAPLVASTGDIDFGQAAVAGYQANYTVCGANGRVVCEVRWNVTQVAGGSWAKMVTVAARQPLAIRKNSYSYTPPITLRTIVGM